MNGQLLFIEKDFRTCFIFRKLIEYLGVTIRFFLLVFTDIPHFCSRMQALSGRWQFSAERESGVVAWESGWLKLRLIGDWLQPDWIWTESLVLCGFVSCLSTVWTCGRGPGAVWQSAVSEHGISQGEDGVAPTFWMYKKKHEVYSILPLSVQLYMHRWRQNVTNETKSNGWLMFLPRSDILCATIS